MTLAEYYITNLVSERIPMINEWAKMTGLQIHSSTQTEQTSFVDSVISERSGYSMLDRLERAYLSHEVSSLEYSDETHYLLGMYLRALKELEGLDYMHLYNCVQYSEVIGSKRYWHVPIVYGRTYTLKANTYEPIEIDLKYSNKSDSLFENTKILSTSGSSTAIILGSTGNAIDWNLINRQQIFDEFLELVVITRPNIQVAVVEGSFSNLIPGRVKVCIENCDFIEISKTVPSILCNYKRFSDKLIELLLDTAITEKSNDSIKEKALQLYPANSIKEAAKFYTIGTYDIDGYIDKRLIV